MKTIWHVLPCGAMYKFKEHTLKDVGEYQNLAKRLFHSLDKEEVRRITGNKEGRGIREIGHGFFKTFIRAFLDELIEQLLNSNRVIINKDKRQMLFIGASQYNPKRITKARKKKQMNWNTNGIWYNIILSGLQHDYYFRMRSDKRKNLALRINSGQNYH